MLNFSVNMKELSEPKKATGLQNRLLLKLSTCVINQVTLHYLMVSSCLRRSVIVMHFRKTMASPHYTHALDDRWLQICCLHVQNPRYEYEKLVSYERYMWICEWWECYCALKKCFLRKATGGRETVAVWALSCRAESDDFSIQTCICPQQQLLLSISQGDKANEQTVRLISLLKHFVADMV